MPKTKSKYTPLSPYGRWLKGRLMDENMSRNELAERIGVKPQNLSKVMHGHIPGIKYRPQIEQVLGKPPEELRKVS